VNRDFKSHVHPANLIEADSPSLSLNSNSIRLYDPEDLTIVSCSQDDWNLVASLAEQPIARLGDFMKFFQGEVNQTNVAARGLLTDSKHGLLVTRGAAISLYQLRDAIPGRGHLFKRKRVPGREGQGYESLPTRASSLTRMYPSSLGELEKDDSVCAKMPGKTIQVSSCCEDGSPGLDTFCGSEVSHEHESCSKQFGIALSRTDDVCRQGILRRPE
jgi:hypothetical protein